MNFRQNISDALAHLNYIIGALTSNQYIFPIKPLSDSSIGQHCRHIIEFFECLLEGYEDGTIDYDKRKRNTLIESDKDYALLCLERIESEMISKDFTKELFLTISSEGGGNIIPTTFGREVSYNIEHTIHHLAIIKIGILIIEPRLKLPENFGIAASTLKHKQKMFISNPH